MERVRLGFRIAPEKTLNPPGPATPMRPRPFLLLLAGVALALMVVDEVEAKTPLWYYETDGNAEPSAISADGNYVAIGSSDTKLYLFNNFDVTLLWYYETGNNVWSVSISEEGDYIVAGTGGFWGDDEISLFHRSSSTPLWTYSSDYDVESVAISADSNYIAAGNGVTVSLFGKDSSTPIWEYDTGDTVLSVGISADGEYIVAGGYDDNIYLFDKDSSTPLWNYTTEHNVYSVAISADGEYIVGGGGDGFVYFFNKYGTLLWSVETESDIQSVAISADGNYVAAGTSYNENKIYYVDAFEVDYMWTYSAEGAVYSIGTSADGEYVAVGSSNGEVYLFDKDSSVPLWEYDTGDYVASVAISQDGGYIVANSGFNTYLLERSTKPVAYLNFVCDNDDTIPFQWVNDGDDDCGDGSDEGVASPTLATEGDVISFQGYGTDEDGFIEAYQWNSNIDGILSTQSTFSISSLSTGTHTITFRVKDNLDVWSEEVSTSLVIHEKPVAYIDEISPNPAVDTDTINFVGHGTDDGGIDGYLWWSHIDGDLSYENSFVITDLSLGMHIIYFTVQDNYGVWSDEASLPLQVEVVAHIDSVQPSTAITGQNVVLTGHGSGTVTGYSWRSSNDGPLSDESTFSTTSLSIGNHVIFFQVRGKDGNWSEEVSESLVIHQRPAAIIDSVSPLEVTEGGTVYFSGRGTDDGSIEEYRWQSSIDGNLSSEASFDSSSLSVGIHTIYFLVRDNYEVWSEPAILTPLNVTEAPEPEEPDDGFLPAPSLAAAVAAVAVIALRRRR